jgi:alkylation response protein AidB-like acyl-CoA dehydrogenase
MLTVTELYERAHKILPQIAADAAERERLRVLPYAQVREIAQQRLLTFRVPDAYGGPGATIAQVIRFVIDVASVDANIAQALRPAFLFTEDLLAAESEDWRRRWLPRVMAGDIFGTAGWERGAANGVVQARLTPDGENYRANGTKSYSTGALYADWITTSALNPGGEAVSFTVPRDREGLRLLDDWDGAGQRLTASGTTELDNMLVYADEILTLPQRGQRSPGRSPGTAFAQLFLAAVLAGIAANAQADAVDYARRHSRPIKHSAANRSVDDPYVQHAVGQVASLAFAADAAVMRAAEGLDRASGDGLAPRLLTEAAVAVAQAQFFAAEAALRSGELAFEAGSASAVLREHNLDRHWRNARTVANHNPRAYKAAVTGAYLLNGTEPPGSLF